MNYLIHATPVHLSLCLQYFILLFTIATITAFILLLLLLFHYYHHYKTVATDKPLRASLFLGAGELTTHLLRLLPSTTRRCMTLNTSVALDSPFVMSKLLTPPHAHATATSSAEFENATDNSDDASTVLDESGSLGSFLDATIARAKMGNTTVTPVSSPESRECPSDDLDDTYIELDDDFIAEAHATRDASDVKKLLARRVVRITYLLMLSLLLLP
jgi:hypothetical protein